MPRDSAEPKNTINLAGTMPPDQHNGLKAILEDMIANPGVQRYAVCQFDALYDKKITDTGTHQIVVRWRRIEPVDGDDAKAVMTLLDESQSARLGQFPMTGPLDD